MVFSLSLCFGNTYALVAGSFLYIGPGRGSDGHSEVFSLPTKSDPQVIKVSCSIPVHPKTDLQDAMGFVMNGFLNLCGNIPFISANKLTIFSTRWLQCQ